MASHVWTISASPLYVSSLESPEFLWISCAKYSTKNSYNTATLNKKNYSWHKLIVQTVALVTKYKASEEIFSVSGELFMMVFTRAWGSTGQPSSIFGLNVESMAMLYSLTEICSITSFASRRCSCTLCILSSAMIINIGSAQSCHTRENFVFGKLGFRI